MLVSLISDAGIGMNREDLIENLGTIAHSGTQKLMDQLEEAKGDVNRVSFILHVASPCVF